MSAPTNATAFRQWFGLTPAGAEILSVLYDAAGKPSQADDLARRAGVSPRSIGFHLFAVRQAMETDGLSYQSGDGYRLAESGLDECRAALRALSEGLAQGAAQ